MNELSASKAKPQPTKVTQAEINARRVAEEKRRQEEERQRELENKKVSLIAMTRF